MPRLAEGAEVVPVEEILRRPRDVLRLLVTARSCRCHIVDYPFTVLASRDGVRVRITVGIGSIVCSGGCGVGGWLLEEPAWCYGRRIGDCKCLYHGPGEGAAMLEALGVHVEVVGSLGELLDSAARGARGVALLPGSKSLEVSVGGGVCGRLRSMNPLHPVGVFGKADGHVCVERLAEPVGPAARGLTPLLGIGRKTVAWLFRGMGEAVLYGFEPSEAPSPLGVAALVGALYTCGVED